MDCFKATVSYRVINSTSAEKKSYGCIDGNENMSVN